MSLLKPVSYQEDSYGLCTLVFKLLLIPFPDLFFCWPLIPTPRRSPFSPVVFSVLPPHFFFSEFRPRYLLASPPPAAGLPPARRAPFCRARPCPLASPPLSLHPPPPHFALLFSLVTPTTFIFSGDEATSFFLPALSHQAGPPFFLRKIFPPLRLKDIEVPNPPPCIPVSYSRRDLKPLFSPSSTLPVFPNLPLIATMILVPFPD